jgi:hypothetical protein
MSVFKQRHHLLSHGTFISVTSADTLGTWARDSLLGTEYPRENIPSCGYVEAFKMDGLVVEVPVRQDHFLLEPLMPNIDRYSIIKST